MRKQLKYIIITAVIIVVLVGGLIAVNLFSGEDVPSTDNNTTGQTEAMSLFDFQAEEITAVDVKNAKGSYTLTQDDDGEVRINGETELPMNSATLSAAYSALTKISSDKVLKENVDNAADYGLSDPVIVTVKAGDAEKTVLIGSETPTNEGVYCMVEGLSLIHI